MTNLYLKIIDELEKNKQVFIQKGMTPPRFIDIWDGQLYDENYEFVYPCIFFDYAANWTYAGKTKTGTATVELHVIAFTFSFVSRTKEKDNKKKNPPQVFFA